LPVAKYSNPENDVMNWTARTAPTTRFTGTSLRRRGDGFRPTLTTYASEQPHSFSGIASVVNLWHERNEWSFSASSPEQY